ncbi:ATP-dependent DNA helicase RecG [hydrothermal vent metagenome]|uniref:ATP-dependent DNA helicase RecG n=1 Tax=hydrothermal vent metagenome TaxID=652676 RepID=A0A3B1D0E4_9ZZZZ
MSTTIDSPIQYLKNVGPKKAEILSSIGINTINDLLYLFPYRYLDRSTILDSSRVVNFVTAGFNGEVTIIGKVVDTEEIHYGRKSVFKVSMKDSKGFFECVWFRSIKYFRDRFKTGEYYAVSAKPIITKYGHLQFTHPDFDKLSSEESEDFLHTGKIIPFYKIPEKFKKANLGELSLRRLIYHAITDYKEQIEETLPNHIIEKNNLLNIKSTIANKHFPENTELLQRAEHRLKFEELFYIESLIALKKYNYRSKVPGISYELDKKLLKQFLDSLPFELTNAQTKVLHQIRLDMESGKPMNRLLQGDVGSGKTVVAVIAMIIAVSNNKQAALMAPTEILAIQHYENIQKMLSNFPIEIELLVGGQKTKEKSKIHSKIKEGKPGIYIGTHALIEDKSEFTNLGLVIVDEQHRFGVAQRSKLISKSSAPDVLVMSATPIPRTLTMTLYGDLDVSVIDELPKNRVPIKTYLRSDGKLAQIYKFTIDKIREGSQAFIVYPLIEESEKLELKAAETYYNNLKETVFKNLNVGLIHGRMSWDEKRTVMLKFANKEYDVLVSTTVIEVGIDIPNANIMIINDAHRFGLSQLHQLRGRIGRGGSQSYCILVTSENFSRQQQDASFNFDFLSDSQIQKNKTIIRLNSLVKYTSGFKLAEIDLKLRGPGDIYGTQQSGIPKFKYADLIDDQKILLKAKQEAFKVIESDPKLRKKENAIMRKIIKDQYRDNYWYSTIG